MRKCFQVPTTPQHRYLYKYDPALVRLKRYEQKRHLPYFFNRVDFNLYAALISTIFKWTSRKQAQLFWWELNIEKFWWNWPVLPVPWLAILGSHRMKATWDKALSLMTRSLMTRTRPFSKRFLRLEDEGSFLWAVLRKIASATRRSEYMSLQSKSSFKQNGALKSIYKIEKKRM